MRTNSIVRTALFRLTLLYVAVFLGAAIVLSIGGALSLSLILERQIRTDIEAEIEVLASLIESEPIGLRETLDARVEEFDEFDYLLLDPTGDVLAGTLESGPQVEDWTYVVPPGGEEDEPAIAKGRYLPGGVFLLVARDAEILYETRDFAFEFAGWGLGLALPLAIGGGLTTSFVTLRRIDRINRATRRIRMGDMSERVPVGSVDDEFNRLSRNINDMLDGIAELTEGIRQVSNDIAHDLRTPLSRLRQDLERAKNDPSTADCQDLIENTVSQIDELLATFSSLLKISQIEAGHDRKHSEPVDLSCLFLSLVETFEPVAESVGKTLTANITEGLQFFGDKALLRQMIANLIENSIRHTPHGAEIDVRLDRNENGTYAVIADNGPGIPKWAREKIFQRFFRLDESRQTSGNGLGLSLVAAIAKYHSIAIQVSDNAPGLKLLMRFPAAHSV